MNRLPTLARWILHRYLPVDMREFIIGDLDEEYSARGRSLASHAWLVREVVALVWTRGTWTRKGDVMRGSVERLKYVVKLLGRDGVRQDLRLALRMLAKDKSFTVAVLITLTICIGANSAMFSIVRSVLMKPLPFADSDRLVLIYSSTKEGRAGGASVPNYFDRKAGVPALEDVAIYRGDTRRLGTADGVEQVRSLRTTPSLLRLLRVQPIQGRLFTDEEIQYGPPAVLLITYELWQRRFGGAPIVNQTIRLNEEPITVVGILPRGFSFLSNEIEIVEPLAFSSAQRADNQRYNGGHQMVGRLRPDATIAAAQAQVDALDASLIDRTPEFRTRLQEAGFHSVVASLQEDYVFGVTGMLYLLWGGVGLVLVIGCVNVGNLVTVRARGRSRELATRHALGADLGQLARQLVCENVLLSLVGGVLGIVLGVWALDWVKAIGADRLPRGFEIAADLTGALATLGLTFVIGLVLGLLPAMRLRTLDLNAELREESRGGTSGRRESLASGVMATAQFAAAFVVIAGAALLLSSFMASTRLELGFEPAGVATATVEMPTPYRNPTAQSQYVRRTLEVLQAMPEVEAAGVTNNVPYTGMTTIAVSAETEPDKRLEPLAVTISPGYFDAMSVPVIAGRDFGNHDGTNAADVRVVIDSALAGVLWPGEDVVGRRLYADAKKTLTVIGVTGNMRFFPPRIGRAPTGTIFFTYDDRPGTTMTFVVKSKTGPTIAARIRAEMMKADPTVPVYRQRSMQEWIDLALTFRRVPMLIAVLYAVVSLILAAVGVYGVVAHGVAQRERELGVRMALGGTTVDIFKLVLVGGVRIVAIGLAIGVVGSYFVGQLMTTLLYGVTPSSVAVPLLVSAILSAVALIATIVPAWRASRIDPVAVLNR